MADAPSRERRGLGRGLEALLGDGAAAQSAATGGALIEIPLDAIVPNPDQPRATLEPAAIKGGDLVAKIARVARDSRDRPKTDVVLQEVAIAKA